MSLRTFVRRHVMTWVMSWVVVVFGMIALQRIGVDRFPFVEFPVVIVQTTLAGGSPETLDASVTSLVEEAVNGVSGIEHIQSTSSDSLSQVVLTFDLKKNIDVAFNEVNARVSRLSSVLPKEADLPVVSKANTEGQPILWLALSGDRTLADLSRYAATDLKRRLEHVKGVGQIIIGGKRTRTLRIALDPHKMAHYGLTPSEVTSALARQHLQLSGGHLVGQSTEIDVTFDFEFHDVAGLEQLILRTDDHGSVCLSDVAMITDGLSDARGLARFNGVDTVGLGMIKISGSNATEVIESVKHVVNHDLIPRLPSGMRLEIASDDSSFILDMIHALKEHLLAGVFWTSVVVWLFLRSLGSALIISLAIPVSLLGAIAGMYFLGYTFNSITLLGLLLLIGVVVDDAIVVLENIARHREMHPNLDPEEASVAGSREVFFPVMASTLTLMCIFIPVVFLEGIVGRFLSSFAVVVVIGVALSWCVSMTLTPMLCARMMSTASHTQTTSGFYLMLDHYFKRMDEIYRQVLAYALSHRKKVLLSMLPLLGLCLLAFLMLGKEFVPEEDEARFNIIVDTPSGMSLSYASQKLAHVERYLKRLPEVVGAFSIVGMGGRDNVHEGMIFVRLKPKADRRRSQKEIMDTLRQESQRWPGMRLFLSGAGKVGSDRPLPFNIAVSGPDLYKLSEVAENIRNTLQKSPELGAFKISLEMNKKQLLCTLNRQETARLGLSPREVGEALSFWISGQDVARFNDLPSDGQRYKIRLKGNENFFKNPEDLKKVYLKTPSGSMVRLDTLLSWKPVLGPAMIERLDQRYTIFLDSRPQVPLQTAMDRVQEKAQGLLPSGYRIDFVGEAEELAKTSRYVGFAFMLATVLLYMVLASQFNSWALPWLIMSAQPLAMMGAVILLWLMTKTLNIFSMLGMILLIGLIAKNGILLVDRTLEVLRNSDLSVDEALKVACPHRLRPVLMTSLTVIVAFFPAALGLGAGSAMTGPLSVAVIGGVLSSTVLTLIVLPTLYSLSNEYWPLALHRLGYELARFRAWIRA